MEAVFPESARINNKVSSRRVCVSELLGGISWKIQWASHNPLRYCSQGNLFDMLVGEVSRCRLDRRNQTLYFGMQNGIGSMSLLRASKVQLPSAARNGSNDFFVQIGRT